MDDMPWLTDDEVAQIERKKREKEPILWGSVMRDGICRKVPAMPFKGAPDGSMGFEDWPSGSLQRMMTK